MRKKFALGDKGADFSFVTSYREGTAQAEKLRKAVAFFI